MEGVKYSEPRVNKVLALFKLYKYMSWATYADRRSVIALISGRSCTRKKERKKERKEERKEERKMTENPLWR